MNDKDLEYLRKMERDSDLRRMSQEEIARIDKALRTNVSNDNTAEALGLVGNIIENQSEKIDVEMLYGLVVEVIDHGERLGAEKAFQQAKNIEFLIAAKFIDQGRYDEFEEMKEEGKGFSPVLTPLPEVPFLEKHLLQEVQTLQGAKYLEENGLLPNKAYFTSYDDIYDEHTPLYWASIEQIDFYIAHGANIKDENVIREVYDDCLYGPNPKYSLKKMNALIKRGAIVPEDILESLSHRRGFEEYPDLINDMVRQKNLKELQSAQEFVEQAKDPEKIYRFGFIPELTMSEEEAQTQDKTIVEHLNAILDFSKGRALKDDELKTVCDLVDKAFLLDCQTCENICKIGNQFEEQLIEERKPFGELYKRLLKVEKTQDRIDYVEESNIKTNKSILNFIAQNDIEGLKYLQDNGIDLSGAEAGHPMIDPCGINLFSYAKTPEMVDFLAKAGCDVNIPIERMCPNFVDPTNEGPYSLLCDAMDRQVPIEVISHMIKAGAKVENDCEQVLWGYRFDAQCEQEYQTNENHSKKDFYSNLAEIERFIQKVDPTAFVEQRRKEIEKRLEEHKNGGVEAKVSGVVVNDELVKIRPSIGTVTPEKAKTLSPIIKEAILEKRKHKK